MKILLKNKWIQLNYINNFNIKLTRILNLTFQIKIKFLLINFYKKFNIQIYIFIIFINKIVIIITKY